jgi:hypothetical protein
MSILRLAFSGGVLVALAALAACSGDGNNTTAASNGTGGSSTGGGGQGAGAGPFAPGPHGAAPQVVNLGGKVLKAPKVLTITWASDPKGADIDKATTEIATSSYWSETTSEYGVGPLTVRPPVHLTSAAPQNITDQTLVKTLTVNTTGTNPAWGAADPSTIYLFVLPAGTVVDAGGVCCTDYDGYHDEAQVGLVGVPYGVVCACPGGFDGAGVDDLQQVTVAMSHELIEAATDPYVQNNAGFAQNDDNNAIWTVFTGGEVADMCEFNLNSFLVPAGSTYMVQQSWSNAAALAGKDPCIPRGTTAPYFNSMPVLPDAISLDYFGAWATRGVKIPVGQSKTIDVQLFSEAPTQGPWKVTAYDYNEFLGGQPNLQLSFDKDTGSNGDVLKLTIKVLSVDPSIKGEGFVLESKLGEDANLSVGAVGN